MDFDSYLQEIDRVVRTGYYRDNWPSLTRHPTPGWYASGKLGIFVHWGLYSVPAFGNEWYSRNMYDPEREEFAYHRKYFGDHKQFGYKDFIPLFRGEKFDADAWVNLFKLAGARFVLPVAEHHDGFAMYQTEFNSFNSVDMGPCRDVLGEIKAAADRAGLRFCASSHRAEHYFFMNMGRSFDSDVRDGTWEVFYGPAVYRPEFTPQQLEQTTENPQAPGPDDAWLRDWMVRTCEFIDRYQPNVLYFDWWIQNHAFKPYLKKIAAYYYNRAAQWGKEVTINYKREAFPPGAATFDVERGALTGISPVTWQTCTAIGKKSWGYTRDNEFKTSRQIICDLIDIVSKNGVMLLNVGPRPDGTITEEETKVLKDLGSWLKVNGEGIYDTVPWKSFGEGDVNVRDGFFTDGDEKAYTSRDFRFTYRAGCVYAFQMRPEGREVLVKSFRSKGMYDFGIEKVELLGGGEVSWCRDGEGLHLLLSEVPDPELPLGVKITLL